MVTAMIKNKILTFKEASSANYNNKSCDVLNEFQNKNMSWEDFAPLVVDENQAVSTIFFKFIEESTGKILYREFKNEVIYTVKPNTKVSFTGFSATDMHETILALTTLPWFQDLYMIKNEVVKNQTSFVIEQKSGKNEDLATSAKHFKTMIDAFYTAKQIYQKWYKFQINRNKYNVVQFINLYVKGCTLAQDTAFKSNYMWFDQIKESNSFEHYIELMHLYFLNMENLLNNFEMFYDGLNPVVEESLFISENIAMPKKNHQIGRKFILD